jgi:cytochrome c oxidase assembly protein subunit 11
MNATNPTRSNRRLLAILAAVPVLMFGFGFALVPLYNVFCEVTGLNGKTGRLSEAQLTGEVDKDRWVTVEFVTHVNGALDWAFRPVVNKVKVHPGELTEALFVARNDARRSIVGQAIPSVTPAQGSLYFNKTECFCFTQQTLAPGEEREMPLRFVVDPRLPEGIEELTLSYTFFDTDQKQAQRAADAPGV